ncbi:MAG: endolytic transglycosylase MltG [Pseudomonadota bacterium]
MRHKRRTTSKTPKGPAAPDQGEDLDTVRDRLQRAQLDMDVDNRKNRRRPEPLVTKGRRATGRYAAEPPVVKKRSKAARHPLVLMLNLIMLLGVMAVIGGVVLLLVGRQMYLADGPLSNDVAVIIERGASVEGIAEGLQSQGIISNGMVFMAAAYGTGVTARLQAGEYVVPARASMAEVLDRLVSGEVVQHTITFAEGLSSAQIVQRMKDNDVLVGTVEEIPPEGSLLPETYAFPRGMSRQRLIEMMQTAQRRALDEIWEGRDSDIPVTSPQDLVVLASIVEKETGVADERPHVASVFVNRLKQRMRLQSDPTILYGLYGGDAWSRSRTIYQSDLQRPNPYNTYQISGLPPGPIANPGRAALEAVAQPAETNDLFFVADGTGGHAFAETYEEHQQNVARWREIERQRAGTPASQ